MKKALIILAVGLLISSVSRTVSEPDVRQVSWWMTPEEVIKAETLHPVDRIEDILMFQTTFAGKDCRLIYSFSNNKLISAAYFFRLPHVNKNDFISDYLELKNALDQKFNNKIRDDVVWKDATYQATPADWGLAVSMGQLEYKATWETTRTKVLLDLSGENSEITLILGYYSKLKPN